mgnify:CR=1 FL=1
MGQEGSGTITRVLNGEAGPEGERLYERVYDELRAIALGQLRREGNGRGIETTVLVHETWLKLAGRRWDNRGHFFGSAARAMRQVLVDEAKRRKSRRKHAGVRTATTIVAPGDPDPVDVLALDGALRELEGHDPRAAAVVTLRYFGGLTMNEVSETLDVGLRTVERDWTHARAWLLERMNAEE